MGVLAVDRPLRALWNAKFTNGARKNVWTILGSVGPLSHCHTAQLSDRAFDDDLEVCEGLSAVNEVDVYREVALLAFGPSLDTLAPSGDRKLWAPVFSVAAGLNGEVKGLFGNAMSVPREQERASRRA